jgi:LPS sulfotransferase NodH|tara:strand:- start:2761 stop:3387 length:627 start_codon:yes stop_codon:yes gene_type:complete
MNRIGMVSTSRAGCTFIRKYLCNVYGMQDPNSWLKKNDYRNIKDAPFANEKHILKILVHYVPEHDLAWVLNDMPKIWLYRRDKCQQFLSHVARLRTGINHVYSSESQPQIKDKSLVATREEYERFIKRQDLFWRLYKAYGFLKNEPLIMYEDFCADPENNIDDLYDWFWQYFGNPLKKRIPMPLKIDVNYEDKFINYMEVVNWFDINE